MSKRFFNWKTKVEDDDDHDPDNDDEEDEEEEEKHNQAPNRLMSGGSSSKLRTALALAVFGRVRPSHRRLIGTLFGSRRGRVFFALQEDTKLSPPFLVELSTPTSVLVREMASGSVRMALECEKRSGERRRSSNRKLVEETVWRSYCNGKKWGYATRRESGEEERRVLKAVEPITMGAGVVRGNGANGSEGEVMYMRARFERVVGSKDSEAYYMMSPEGCCGGPELSVYLLRV